jgi:hypothetical protein
MSEIEFSDPPFYVYGAFNRLCKPDWECDYCVFFNEDEADLYDVDGKCCPESLWYYVTKRNSVIEKFQLSKSKEIGECK